jgi:hypothetical protein
MFDARDIRTRLRERPFTPFVLVVSTGEGYAIRHPEQVLVTPSYVYVSVDVDGDTSDEVSRVALLHVVELRDLPASAEGDGPG